MTRHNIEGWAFTASEQEGKAANAERWKEIGSRRRDLVESLGPSVGRANYRCKTAPDLSPNDLAILCDEGNVCFGAVVDIAGDTARVTIWTD